VKAVPEKNGNSAAEDYPKPDEIISHVYLCKCLCGLHFAVYSNFADKTWKCPECGRVQPRRLIVPSKRAVCELFTANLAADRDPAR